MKSDPGIIYNIYTHYLQLWMESDPFAEFLEFHFVDDNEDDDDGGVEKSRDSVLPRDLNSAPLQGQVNA